MNSIKQYLIRDKNLVLLEDGSLEGDWPSDTDEDFYKQWYNDDCNVLQFKESEV